MSRSSADPVALDAYERGSAAPDREVADAARRLAGALQDLAASGSEGLTPDVALPAALAQHASRSRQVAEGVGLVGRAFDAADRAGLVGPRPPRTVDVDDAALALALLDSGLLGDCTATGAPLGTGAYGPPARDGRALLHDLLRDTGDSTADLDTVATLAHAAEERLDARAQRLAQTVRSSSGVRGAARSVAGEAEQLVRLGPLAAAGALHGEWRAGRLGGSYLGAVSGVATAGADLVGGSSVGTATVNAAVAAAPTLVAEVAVGAGLNGLAAASGGVLLVPGVGQVVLVVMVGVAVGYGVGLLLETDLGAAAKARAADLVDGVYDLHARALATAGRGVVAGAQGAAAGVAAAAGPLTDAAEGAAGAVADVAGGAAGAVHAGWRSVFH